MSSIDVGSHATKTTPNSFLVQVHSLKYEELTCARNEFAEHWFCQTSSTRLDVIIVTLGSKQVIPYRTPIQRRIFFYVSVPARSPRRTCTQRPAQTYVGAAACPRRDESYVNPLPLDEMQHEGFFKLRASEKKQEQ